MDRRRGLRRVACHALHAYDRIIGLDLSEVAIDGSLHKAPCGGEGTGTNPTDRAKLGWKWSIATDANGIPIGWAIDGANRNDVKLLGPTLDDVDRVDCCKRSRPSTSTGATTIPNPHPAGRSRPRRSQHPTPLEAWRRQHGETADAARPALGGRRAPTRGSATTASSVATRTGEPDTATPSSAWSSPCSSLRNSSTGATGGARIHALSADPLSALEALSLRMLNRV